MAEEAEVVTLHVGNLTRNVGEAHLREVFSSFGALSAVDLQVRSIDHGPTSGLMRAQVDREVGLSKGFAYVSYRSAEEAEAAVLSMDGGQLDGNALKVSFILVANSKRRRESPGERCRILS